MRPYGWIEIAVLKPVLRTLNLQVLPKSTVDSKEFEDGPFVGHRVIEEPYWSMDVNAFWNIRLWYRSLASFSRPDLSVWAPCFAGGGDSRYGVFIRIQDGCPSCFGVGLQDC